MSEIIITDKQACIDFIESYLHYNEYEYNEELTGLNKEQFLASVTRIMAEPEGHVYCDLGNGEWFPLSDFPEKSLYDEFADTLARLKK